MSAGSVPCLVDSGRRKRQNGKTPFAGIRGPSAGNCGIRPDRYLYVSTFASLSPFAKNELWATLALRHAYGIGPRRAKRLVEAYGSVFQAVEAGLASPSGWVEKRLVPKNTAGRFLSGGWRDAAKLEWGALKVSGCSFLLWSDARYPASLREIDDPPLLLYYKGDPALLHGPAVGVVGARNCTREGIAVSAFFSRNLSKAGVAVISGMAKGIDRAAHLAGLEGAGRSIAVLGTGVDVAYPACNADIYNLLSRQGLVLSEFAPGTGPSASHFPIRNRLISGLSRGVLVVEAAGRSGSLITARLALEQNRDVFAVPGHTTAAVSEGCRELIRRGAKPVFNADDVLLELAPALTLEAQKALLARQEEARRQSAKVRARAGRSGVPAETADAVAEQAVTVLPECGLPWAAPVRASAKASPGKPSSGDRPRLAGPSATPAAPTVPAGPLPRPAAPAPDECRVLDALQGAAVHIDAISRLLDMDVAQLSGLLTLLEVRGLVRRAPGMVYSLPEESR